MKRIMLLIIVIFFALMLTGCWQTTSNGWLYQEDYDGNCFRPGVTWSEMSLCLKNDRDKEWQQNHLTNDLSKSS